MRTIEGSNEPSGFGLLVASAKLGMKSRARTLCTLAAAILLSVAAGVPASAQSQSFTTPGANTFTPPEGVAVISAQGWGGGGGGGSSNTTNNRGGGGGAGGAYATTASMTLTSRASVTVTVGAAGTAGSASAGGTGGTSTATFSTTAGSVTVAAVGGPGGARGPSGAGGGGTTTGSSGTTLYAGGNGSAGSAAGGGYAGAGGGGAGSTGAGGNASAQTAGTGTATGGGNGGAGRNTFGPGNPGSAAGGGGGAGYKTSAGGEQNGGAGGAGRYDVTWTVPTAASGLTFGTVTDTSIAVSWTNGNCDKRLVVVKSGAAVGGTPTDLTAYTANATFGSGSTIAAGEYVVYADTGTSVTVTGLTAGTTYYFKIFSYNIGAGTDGTSSAYLSTGAPTGNTTTLLAAPTLVSPLDGATRFTSTPAFDWTDVSGASTYDFQLDDDPAFGSPNASQTGLAASNYTLAAAEAQADGTYYWRARGVDGGGTPGAYSASRTLTISTTAPALLSPADGTTTSDSTPSFDWADKTGAADYELQIDDDPLFGSVNLNKTGLSTSDYTLAAAEALADGTWYWRVRARDADANATPYSASPSIIIDTVAPGAPTLLSPANGSATSNTTPAFDWSDISDPAPSSGLGSYELQIDNDPAFGSVDLNKTGLATSAYTLAAAEALADGTWYWRARVLDAAGNASPYSSSRSIVIDTVAPSAPTLLSPANGSATSNTTPAFDWSDIVDAAPSSGLGSYELQIDDDPLFGSVNLNKTGLATSDYTLAAAEALADGTWYWRARVLDAAGNISAYSASRSIVIDTVAPSAPSLVSPANGSLTNDNTPAFDWSDIVDAAPSSGLGSYELQIDDDPLFGSVNLNKTGLATSDYTLAAAEALADGTWYWRARVLDAAGNISAYSASRSIVIDATAPSAPTLLSPANGSATSNTTPAFDWSDISDPAPSSGLGSYELQIDDDPLFGSVNLNKTGLATSAYTLAAAEALADGTWYWRARVLDAAGNASPYSSSRSIVIDAVAPSAPTLLSPANGSATSNTTPAFDWSDISDPAPSSGLGSYELQIDDDPLFGSVNLNKTGLATSDYTLAAAEALADGTWYWRARVLDAAGNASAYSASRSIVIDTVAPSAPTLISPADGAGTSPQPSFDWSDISDPAPSSGLGSYELQIDDDPLFGSVDLNKTGLATSAYTLVAAEALTVGTWYWRARVLDAAGNTSPYSGSSSIIVSLAPTLLSPPDGSATNDNTPAFDWTDVGGAVSYDFQIDDDSAFGSVNLSKTGLPTSDTTLAAAEALPDGTWYWRARRDGGAWSAPFSLIVDTVAPDAPTLLSPANGSATSNTTPAFDWSDISDPAPSSGLGSYELQIDDDPLFGSVNLNKTGLATSDYTLAAAEALTDATYYWRARVLDAAGNAGPYSASRSIVIDSIAPGVPTLLSPTDASTINDNTPLFDWTTVADATAVTYELQIDDDPAFGSINIDKPTLTSSDYTLAAAEALADGVWYWRVQATDAAGNASGFSAPFSFTLDATAPPAVANISPADGATVGPSVALDWSNSVDPGGVTYEVEVDDALTFASPLVFTSAPAVSNDTTPALTNGLYYWRARAVDAAGNTSAWSTPTSFTVDGTPPPAVTLVSPADAALVDAAPLLTWNPITTETIDTYKVWVDTTSPPVTVVGTSDTNSFQLAALTDGTYYWMISAVDLAGNEGPPSAIRSFTVDATPPTVPVKISPADLSTVTASPVAFDWGDSIDANGVADYRIEIYDAAPQIVFSSDTPVSAINASLPNGTFTWRVRAIDTVGNASAWSGFWTFTLASGAEIVPPTVPVLISPADLSVLGPGIVTLDWLASTDASGIDYYVVRLTDPAGLVTQITTTALTTPTPSLTEDGSYLWQVEAVDLAGNHSGFSAPFTFTIATPDTTTPSVPVLLLPGNGLSFPPGAIFLDWSDATDDVAVASYDVQVYSIDSAGAFLIVYANSVGASSDTTPLLPDGAYAWRVQAIDTSGNASGFSPYAYFTMDSSVAADVTGPTSAPGPTSPPDGSSSPDRTPTFSWSGSSDPETGIAFYRLELFDAAAALVFMIETTSLTADSPLALTDGTYTWQVTAFNGAGLSLTSALRSFTIDSTLDTTPPSAVTLLTPTGGSTPPPGPVTFSWTAAGDDSGVVTYLFQISDNPDFTSPLVFWSNTDQTSIVVTIGSGAFYWRVFAVDGSGNVGAAGLTGSFGQGAGISVSGSSGSSGGCSALSAAASGAGPNASALFVAVALVLIALSCARRW
jgi:nitrogen fixation protein FixH